MSIIGTTPSPGKVYPGSADEDFLKEFDMTVNNTSVYGTYSVKRPIDPEGTVSEDAIITDAEFLVTNTDLALRIADYAVEVQMEQDIKEGVDDLDGGSF